MVLENETNVVPQTRKTLVGHHFRPRFQPLHLLALRQSIIDVLECMPHHNAQRQYIEALDMRVDEWILAGEDRDKVRPRVSLADLDIMWMVVNHKCGNGLPVFVTQLERMIEVLREGGW